MRYKKGNVDLFYMGEYYNGGGEVLRKSKKRRKLRHVPSEEPDVVLPGPPISSLKEAKTDEGIGDEVELVTGHDGTTSIGPIHETMFLPETDERT